MPEELLLNLLFDNLLLGLFFENFLYLIFVGVVLVDLPLVVCAEFVSGLVEVVCGHQVALVVLAHSEPVDRQLLAVLVPREDCQFNSLAVLYCRPLQLEPIAAQPSHVKAGEGG